MLQPQYTQEIPLRGCQEELIQGGRESFRRGNKRIILQAPTGFGKTRVASAMIQVAVNKGKKVLFLAPRRELIYQCSETLSEFGIPNDIVMAGEECSWSWPVRVASKDTLYTRGILKSTMVMPEADLVIVDEAHLSTAPTYQAIFNCYPNAALLGLTATPAGPKGRGLGDIYEDMVLSWDMQKLIEHGYLVPARYFEPSLPDLSDVDINSGTGDYVVEGKRGVERKFDEPKLLGDVFENWNRICPNRKTVVFGCSRKHGQHLCHEFLKRKITAEYVDGETDTDERKEIFRRFKQGKTQVLTNCLVLNYGIDIPSIECVVLAFSTKDIRKYVQAAGRGLRPNQGKKDVFILDHGGIIREHGYLTDPMPWSLEKSTTIQERKEKLTKKKAEKGETQLKDIKCARCSAVFRGKKVCPECGFMAIPRGEPIPVVQAELEEIKPKTENRKTSIEEKSNFYAQLKQFGINRGYKPGWAANQYRQKFGVWPNDPRIKNARPKTVTVDVRNWIKSRQIAFAKGKAA